MAELENVEMLIAVLGEEVTPDEAQRLLVLAGNDINLAISIHFDGVNANADNGNEEGEGPSPDPREHQLHDHEPQDPSAGGLRDQYDRRDENRLENMPVSSDAVVFSPDQDNGQTSLGSADAGPGGASPAHRQPVHAEPPSDPWDDDDEHTGCVLVRHEDALPEMDSPTTRSRRRMRPGTAPTSRHAGEDMRDLQSKKEAMRCVLGPDVEDSILEHLLRSNGGEVQIAIEAYFDVGSHGPSATPQPQNSGMNGVRVMAVDRRDELRNGSERHAPSRAARQPPRSEDGPRKPFEDLAHMIGSNVKARELAPLMVETEGDVAKAIELLCKRRTEAGVTGQPLESDSDSESAESYYLRPEKPVQVICNVYDLCWGQDKDGKKKKTNSGLTGVGLGVYHSGIEVYGREISFGYSDDGATGVFEVPGKCAAGVMPNITFKESVVMGTLNRSRFEVDHLLQRLATKYRGDTYDLVRCNCNHFANELCVCLVGKKIPSYINRPANMGRVLLNTISVPAAAFGKIIDGVKGNAKRRDGKVEVPVVVDAPSAQRVIAAGPASRAQNQQDQVQAQRVRP